MTSDGRLIEAAGIIRRCLEAHNPAHIFVGLSGGNDSMGMAHFAAQHIGRPFTVLHLNTGIGIPQTREHVRSVCKARGWPLLEIRAKEDCGQDYEELVIAHGFPGPKMHTKMYNRLKERCLEWLARQIKGNFVIVSGMRKQESKKRMRLKPDPIQVEGRRIWCSPFFFLSNDELREYREREGVPESEVAKNLCMSGECLCGAYASKGELKEIEFFYPEVGAYLRDLERRVRAAGFPWGWDEQPPKWWALMQRAKRFGQVDAFEDERQEALGIMCSSCEARSDGRKAA